MFTVEIVPGRDGWRRAIPFFKITNNETGRFFTLRSLPDEMDRRDFEEFLNGK